MSQAILYSPEPLLKPSRPAQLVLEDGSVFQGLQLGLDQSGVGEVVFTTAMTGYQELYTDPSYCDQILVTTLAHVGNVGVNREDDESERCWLAGVILADLPRRYSNWRAVEDLDDWLRQRGVVGLHSLDTRALVRHIRSQGAMRGVIGSLEHSPGELQQQALASPSMSGADLVSRVTCPQIQWMGQGRRVVAYDFGIKRHMLTLLQEHGFEVVRVPARTPAAEVLALQPAGIFLSNGPGDPAALDDIVEQIQLFLGKIPLFGICLGHQLLARALGGSTYKLKFGHRGGNQPVQHLASGRVEITTQNHGFAVDIDSLQGKARISHLNLNDHTCEGLEAPELKAFSVQYHPESSPGPHDSRYLFQQFVEWMS